MRLREQLIGLLADGDIHSGSAMAQSVGCSRTAVWKHLRELRELGLDIEAGPGRGYQLRQPIELLDRESIREQLSDPAADALDELELFGVIESTSDHLRARPAPPPGRVRVALAEYQTGGRGRRGRRWLSPYGSGLCLSLGWGFSETPRALPALSLAAGVAVCRGLAFCRPAGLGLKWPNDIVVEGGKLGGLLVDVEGESVGPIKVVIGVGINIDCSDRLARDLAADRGLPPVGLRAVTSDRVISRNTVAAGMISELHAMLVEYSRTGFDSFVEDWRRHDSLVGRRVSVETGSQNRTGIANGIAPDGALLLTIDGDTLSVTSGEVSIRTGE